MVRLYVNKKEIDEAIMKAEKIGASDELDMDERAVWLCLEPLAMAFEDAFPDTEFTASIQKDVSVIDGGIVVRAVISSNDVTNESPIIDAVFNEAEGIGFGAINVGDFDVFAVRAVGVSFNKTTNWYISGEPLKTIGSELRSLLNLLK